MDDKFLPAHAAITSDNAEELERLVRADPSLATDRSLSTCDHPTLLCGLVLEMPARRSLVHLIRHFSQFGAELNGPLVAAACIDNVLGVETLLDLGAPVAGEGTSVRCCGSGPRTKTIRLRGRRGARRAIP